jgi:hypothetical protein
MYLNKEHVTLESLHRKVTIEKQIYEIGKTSLYNAIKKIGFRYKKTDNRRGLCAQSHIVAQRISFLRSYIKNLRSDKPWAFAYTDETWVFSKGSEKQTWQDDSSKSLHNKGKSSCGKRYTKRVAGLRSIPYATRLQMLDLPTLQHRRRRGDLIWTYKILTNNESDELLNLFEFNTNIHLRSHRFKLKIQNFKTSVRSHFLPNRVFSDWNALSDEIVNASNPNIFKNKLDAHFR